MGAMAATDGLLIFSTLVSASFWLKHFTRKMSSIYKSSFSTHNNIQNYRRLQILLIYFNYSYISVLIPILFCWIPTSLAIITCFASVRFHGFLSFFEYFPFPTIFNNMIVVLTVTMVPAVNVYRDSEKMYQHLKASIGWKKVFRKELVSMRPFGVRMSPVKVIKPIAILMSYDLISNNVFTLLITFPEATIKHISKI